MSNIRQKGWKRGRERSCKPPLSPGSRQPPNSQNRKRHRRSPSGWHVWTPLPETPSDFSAEQAANPSRERPPHSPHTCCPGRLSSQLRRHGFRFLALPRPLAAFSFLPRPSSVKGRGLAGKTEIRHFYWPTSLLPSSRSARAASQAGFGPWKDPWGEDVIAAPKSDVINPVASRLGEAAASHECWPVVEAEAWLARLICSWNGG